MLFPIVVMHFASVTATSYCESALAAVEKYSAIIVNPIIEPNLDESERFQRKNLLLEAALGLINAQATPHVAKQRQCYRVFDALNFFMSLDPNTDRWSIVIARITVLLGGKTLPQEENDVILVLGSRIFELLRKSRVTVRFGEEQYSFPSVYEELRTLKFFETHGRSIANKLLNGLNSFEKGLIEWESVRKIAAKSALKRRGFLATGFQRFRNELFLSYPAGYVLTAICEVTADSMLDLPLTNELYGPVFGATFTDQASVVHAISPLVDFSQFSNSEWLDALLTEKMRDLLNAIMSADFFMVNTRVIIHDTEVAALPGLVFVRWIAGRYNTGIYSGKDRISLASRAAKIAVKLADGNLFQFPVKAELDQARQVVLTFLEGGSDDLKNLNSAFSWFNKIPWARTKLGLSYAYIPGDLAYAYLLAKSHSQI